MAGAPFSSLQVLLTLLVLAVTLVQSSLSQPLQLNFYRRTCPRAELVVRRVLEEQVKRDPTIPAGLLRMHFHDCFIRGCDASVLIDSEGGNKAEKDSPPNQTLRGYEVIDKIKLELEKSCKGVVSCADILALATRDGVALSGGLSYQLPTGRRDGTVSKLEDVKIPGPFSPIDTALTAFNNIGLDMDDLTTLLGAHAIGFCHCAFFVNRLYNSGGPSGSDPNLDQKFVQQLKTKCPRPLTQIFNLSVDPLMFMNPASSSNLKLDSSLYSSVLSGKAVLQLDGMLAFTDYSLRLATEYVNQPDVFQRKFGDAMIKLGNVGVLTGQHGEIRQNCRRVNSRSRG